MKNKNLKEYNVKNVLSKKAIKLIMTSAILFSGGYTLVNAGNGDIKSILQIAEASVSHRDTERISIGNNHTLAIRDDGYVYAWGGNTYGQLGDVANPANHTPWKINGLEGIVEVTTGSYHSLALTSEGEVYSWGYNNQGQLGLNTSTQIIYTPSKIEGLPKIVSVSAGDYFSLAVAENGSLYGWGLNTYDQLGLNSRVKNYLMPVKINVSNVVEATAGGDFGVALTSDGSVWAWGHGSNGRVGNNSTISNGFPKKIAGLSNIKKIKSSNATSFAITEDGKVYGWGANNKNQIGDSSTTDRLLPVLLPKISNSIETEGGAGFSIAINSDKTLSGWGVNNMGQLGLGTQKESRTPVKSTYLSDIVEISSGSNGAAAITSDGSVYEWGGTTNTYKIIPALLSGFKVNASPTEGILGATAAVIIAEQSKLQADVTEARTLVNALPTGTEKTNLTSRLDTVQTAINLAAQIATSTTSVVKAEGSRQQADVDASRLLVNNLPSGTEKTSLTNRLNVVQKEIDDAKALAEQIATATTAVLKAEGSKLQGDVTAARSLVTALPNGTEKTNLNNRLEKVQTAIDLATQIETATASVVKSEGSKLQGDVTVARTLVEALPTGTEKTNLTNRLNVVQKAIEDAKALAEQIATATTSVVKAEGSKLQIDVDSSRSLVNQLLDGTEKISLTTRLDKVQEAIDEEKALAEQIVKATTSVIVAEASKYQTDVDSSRKLVNALPKSEERTILTARLDKIQSAIDSSNTKYQEMLTEILDMKNYLVTGEGTRADVLAMKDALNEILESSRALLSESHRTDVVLHVQDVLDIIKLLENIWGKIEGGELAGLDELVTQLPESQLKENTEQEVEGAKVTEKEMAISKAIDAVVKAEGSKSNADIEEARKLVNGLHESTEKMNLSDRLDALELAISIEGLLKDAKGAVDNLGENPTSEKLAEAKGLVSKLPDGQDKTALSERIQDIELRQNATKAVLHAEKMQTNYNILLAERAIQQLTDEQLKANLTERIEELKRSILAESKVKTAEISRSELDLADAIDSVNKLKEGLVKTALNKRIQAILDVILEEEQAALLKDAMEKVYIAELEKREPFLENAKLAVEKLKDGPDKSTLEDRLEAISAVIPPTEGPPVKVDPALLKAAEQQVTFAERYKREPYFTRAQEAIDKLPSSEERLALQKRLDMLLAGTNQQIAQIAISMLSDENEYNKLLARLFPVMN
ncbi:RCC1 domain-containing protein [Psychrobacillus sp. FSL K6-1464]|uniref:RCC1 domain-containing protein n=1 Tax=Psychrobacillus sp. FSL K6-1464 TaxID=2921545 RepID=UPI0030FC561C